MWKSSLAFAAMAVMLAGACATAPPPPAPMASVDVSGNWAGTWWAFEGSGGAGTMSGTFAQEGTTIRGDFTVVGAGPNPNRTYVAGSIDGNVISLVTPTSGTLQVDGDQILGTVNGLVTSRIKLNRQR